MLFKIKDYSKPLRLLLGGFLINEKGTMWINKANFEMAHKSAETTDIDLSSELPESLLIFPFYLVYL